MLLRTLGLIGGEWVGSVDGSTFEVSVALPPPHTQSHCLCSPNSLLLFTHQQGGVLPMISEV